ncbi:MAG TPA: serine hydrolase [Phycisphaerae bacterium]|nr:serine hydrolase [Phycisphaerae bacterium]
MPERLTRRTMLFLSALIAGFLVHRGAGRILATADDAQADQYAIPPNTHDGWSTASLKSQKVNAELIQELLDRIDDNVYKNIHGVLLVKNGKLVLEEYFSGTNSAGQRQTFTRDTLHEMHSATKSVNAVLIGIAIDQHQITGVNEKISVFFPEYADIFADRQKAAICLKDLLTMSAGLSWDEWTYPYTDPRNDAAAMAASSDYFRYLLTKPIVSAPGEKFVYNSGISLLLGQIIYKATGKRADKFAQSQLFAPLGIVDYYWQKAPSGVVNTLGGLMLRPRDMAKIGQLYLNGGRWGGKQVVSNQWVIDSTKLQSGAGQLPAWVPATGYGYQWWLGSFRLGEREVGWYGALGRGGQFIIIFPELQLVATFTGWNDGALGEQPVDMLQRYILPAMLPRSAN